MTGGVPRGPRSLEDAPDQDLVALVRAGDAAAYATLWKRHSGSAYGVARTFTRLDADDLVSEAFAKVLHAIRAGGGPVRAFRPYITMTVRNVARTLHVREACLVDADLESRRTEVPNGEVAAVVRFERDVTLEAFNSLPERWQQVLWYSEVDGLKAGTISRSLGIPANAVSALLVRARRAFRDAWVSAHSAAGATPECAATIRDLGAFVQHRLSSRRTAAVEAHLGTCENCRGALAEVRHASSMILLLLPLVAAAAAYAAGVAADTAPQALRSQAAARTVAERAAVGATSSASVPGGALVLGWAAGIVLVGAMTAGVVVGQETSSATASLFPSAVLSAMPAGAGSKEDEGTTAPVGGDLRDVGAFSDAPPEAWVALSHTAKPPEAGREAATPPLPAPGPHPQD